MVCVKCVKGGCENAKKVGDRWRDGDANLRSFSRIRPPAGVPSNENPNGADLKQLVISLLCVYCTLEFIKRKIGSMELSGTHSPNGS